MYIVKRLIAHPVLPVHLISGGTGGSAPDHGWEREKVPIAVGYTAVSSLPASGPELLSTGKTNGRIQPSAVCMLDCEILLPRTS